MLKVNLAEKKSIAILEPSGALCEDDFGLAVKIIDPFIEKIAQLSHLRFQIFPQNSPTSNNHDKIITPLDNY